MLVRPPLCERAQNWVSLRLDDELSEFEIALLDSHLGRCAACREFALDANAFTTVLRSRPLEEPEALVILPPLRQRLRFRASEVAAAVALVVATAGAVDLARSPGSSGGSLQIDLRQAPASATQDDTVDVVAARRAHLLAMTSRWWVPRRGFRLT